MVEWGELSFKVVRLEQAGQEILARAGNFLVARAAFDMCVSLYQDAEVSYAKLRGDLFVLKGVSHNDLEELRVSTRFKQKRTSCIMEGRLLNRDIAQLIIMISGAVLLTVGIIMIIPQFCIEMWIYYKSATISPSQFDASKGIKLGTQYVGVMVLAIGATLEIVGYVSTLPWRDRKHST